MSTPASQVGTPTTASPSLLSQLASIEAKVDTLITNDKAYIQKYWPLAVGILIAASRFL